MNSLFLVLGIESWKPVISALLLPPVPLLLLVALGAWLLRLRPALGGWLVGLGLALIWLSATVGATQALSRWLLRPPEALGRERIEELQLEARSRRPQAIVVLGGGADDHAPEYGTANLRPLSIERLRYGVWLARQTGIPLAFSGGSGHGRAGGMAEAGIAAAVAEHQFGLPLTWVEDSSRDTRENASRSVALLQQVGIEHLVLVTHAVHMPRALAAFQEAAAGRMRIEAAPMGLARGGDGGLLPWLPSSAGFQSMRNMLHELAGRALGA